MTPVTAPTAIRRRAQPRRPLPIRLGVSAALSAGRGGGPGGADHARSGGDVARDPAEPPSVVRGGSVASRGASGMVMVGSGSPSCLFTSGRPPNLSGLATFLPVALAGIRFSGGPGAVARGRQAMLAPLLCQSAGRRRWARRDRLNCRATPRADRKRPCYVARERCNTPRPV
jgi:hypothetical protein